MNTLEQLVLGWECLGAALRSLSRPATWVVWLPLALARFGALAVLSGCAHPLVSAFAAPLVTALAGEGALHYPALFRLLPMLFARVDAALLATLGLWTAGAASIEAVSGSGGAPRGPLGSLAHATRRLPALFLAASPALVAGWLLSDGVAMWLDARGSGGLIIRIITLMAALVALLVAAYVAWLPVLVAAAGHGVVDAWHELGRLAGRSFPTALAITFVTTLPTLPMWFLLRSPGRWIDRGFPEVVALLLAAGVALTLLTRLLATVAIALAWRAIEEDPWHG